MRSLSAKLRHSLSASIMDSFPLLELTPLILQRFVTLCHPDDAMELAKCCKQMNIVVKEFGYKNVSNLAIHGKALPEGVPQFEMPLSSEYGNLSVSCQDPAIEILIKKTIVTEKLGITNLEMGILTKLTNLGLFWNCRYIFVFDSILTKDEFNLLFRSKSSLEIAEFQQVSINPSVTFSDTLDLLKGCQHIHLQISNMIYSDDPIGDLIAWQRTAPLTGLTMHLPANGFSFDRLVDFFSNISIPPYQATFTFNEAINESMNIITQNYFSLHRRMPRISRHHYGCSVFI